MKPWRADEPNTPYSKEWLICYRNSLIESYILEKYFCFLKYIQNIINTELKIDTKKYLSGIVTLYNLILVYIQYIYDFFYIVEIDGVAVILKLLQWMLMYFIYTLSNLHKGC